VSRTDLKREVADMRSLVKTLIGVTAEDVAALVVGQEFAPGNTGSSVTPIRPNRGGEQR
jgi:hypothetical protein